MAIYDSIHESRLDILEQFQAQIQAVDLRDDQVFRDIMRQTEHLLEMSDREIADALSVSRPTINRWMNGRNLPYPAMRKATVEWIRRQVSARIKRLQPRIWAAV